MRHAAAMRLWWWAQTDLEGGQRPHVTPVGSRVDDWRQEGPPLRERERRPWSSGGRGRTRARRRGGRRPAGVVGRRTGGRARPLVRLALGGGGRGVWRLAGGGGRLDHARRG